MALPPVNEGPIRLFDVEPSARSEYPGAFPDDLPPGRDVVQHAEDGDGVLLVSYAWNRVVRLRAMRGRERGVNPAARARPIVFSKVAAVTWKGGSASSQ